MSRTKKNVKVTAAEYGKEWYRKNKDYVKKRTKLWQQSNKDKLKIARYKYNHSPEGQAANKAYRERTKERVRELHVKRRTDNPWRYMVACAKARAKLKDVPFNLTEVFIKKIGQATKKCPALGVTLKYGYQGYHGDDNHAELDRVDINKGYTEDNVWFLSRKANRAKNDCTLRELQLIVDALGKQLTRV